MEARHSPLTVTFRGMDRSDAVEAKVRERAEKLDDFYPRIMNTRVAVEALHHRHEAGNQFNVRVEVHVPGEAIVADREPGAHHRYNDVYVAIRDSFDSARRMLEDHARREQGKVKTHELPGQGRVVEIHPARDHGVIETLDGRAIYFHRNALLEGDFDTLAEGAAVRFNEEMGEEGPQATGVRLLGKPH